MSEDKKESAFEKEILDLINNPEYLHDLNSENKKDLSPKEVMEDLRKTIFIDIRNKINNKIILIYFSPLCSSLIIPETNEFKVFTNLGLCKLHDIIDKYKNELTFARLIRDDSIPGKLKEISGPLSEFLENNKGHPHNE